MNPTSFCDRVPPHSRFFKFSCFALALLAFLSMRALGDPEGHFQFQPISSGAQITRYVGPGGNVVIPSQLGGRPVVTIGVKAFYGIDSLTHITIPRTVESIRSQAFGSCINLIAIDVDSLNPYYSSLGGVLFDKAQTTIRAYPGGKAGPYLIQDSVTLIWPYAFEGCRGLTAVGIPNNVAMVHYKTFSGCANLTNVAIGNRVTTIEGLSFEGCTRLTEVTIPSSVTNIWIGAFSDCTNMTSIGVDSLNPVYSSLDGLLLDKAQAVLLVCPEGKAGVLSVPDGLNSIGNYAFFDCDRLTSITIPNTVTSIGTSAFAQCIGLTNVTIPNSVASISDRTFSGCTGMTSVTIPNSIATIGISAFYSCTGLSSVTFPDSLTAIGNSAFSSCTGLTNVSIPNSVTLIGNGAFSGCKSLAFIAIPSSVTAVGDAVFHDCTSLTEVTIPNSVTAIGISTFAYCSSLTHLSIPDSVTSIGNFGFAYCTGLTSVTIPKSMTSIGSSVFYFCTGLTNITLPNSVTSIGSAAFARCTGLMSVTIPDSVTSIAGQAFQYCTSLTGVYFEGNAPLLKGDPFSSFPHSTLVTVFYRLGAMGWEATYGGRPTAVWKALPAFGDWAVSTGLKAQFPDASGEADDPDADGMTNHDEWFASTDPTLSASRLELEFTPRGSDLAESDKTPIESWQSAIYFRSVPGRYYSVQRAAGLGGEWELEDVRIASTTQTRFAVRTPTSRAFYRVLALP